MSLAYLFEAILQHPLRSRDLAYYFSWIFYITYTIIQKRTGLKMSLSRWEDWLLEIQSKLGLIQHYNMPIRTSIVIALLSIFAVTAFTKCAYTQPPAGGLPYIYDGDPFPMNYTLQVCKDYLGENVCCNEHNSRLTADNLKQVDGAFASASGGCDICAINLKRLWCEYACSPRQADFLKVSQEYYTYPDPQKPGKTIVAQEANLTIQASTACAIYDSCKRVPFVTSVSALGSPAGFLNFQGHNAIDNARQYISVFFTYEKEKGLYFNNETGKQMTANITSCDYKGTELHGFQITEVCNCNTCEEACDNSQGFHYFEASVFEGFNLALVLGFYGFVGVVVGVLSYYRYRSQKIKLY